MGTTYFRRFRMELDLQAVDLPVPKLPDGYRWVSWEQSQLERHAQVKFDSFREEIDSRVFSSLSHLEGCQRLMSEIARQSTFLPASTWLVEFCADPTIATHACATIQGLARTEHLGAIQNVGVVPEHRGFGLGRAVVLKCLSGFRDSGLSRVYLEVTSSNEPAVELYRSIGFRLTRTMYKAVDKLPPASVTT